MRKSWFAVEQIVAVLKQVELGMSIADVTRRVGISEQTFYRWKKQYAGLEMFGGGPSWIRTRVSPVMSRVL